MAETVNLAERFALSEQFKTLFQDGMGLVEQSAAYLDGEGRQAAKGLPREVAMLYGTESMRLTTRLMQLASWLLLQRAANDGEMTREQLLEEKKKIKLEAISESDRTPQWANLPPEFVNLVVRSVSLQNRVITLDAELYGARDKFRIANDNPVDQQIDLLSTALGASKQSR